MSKKKTCIIALVNFLICAAVFLFMWYRFFAIHENEHEVQLLLPLLSSFFLVSALTALNYLVLVLRKKIK